MNTDRHRFGSVTICVHLWTLSVDLLPVLQDLFQPGTLMALAVLASTILYLILEQGFGLSK